MRAANLMRAAHRPARTRLSRAAHRPPRSTPSHFALGTCARQCRETATHFHKGAQDFAPGERGVTPCPPTLRSTKLSQIESAQVAKLADCRPAGRCRATPVP